MIGLKLIGNDFDYEIKTLIKVFYPLEEIKLNEIDCEVIIEAIIKDNNFICNVYRNSEKLASYTKTYSDNTDKKKAKGLLKFVVYNALVNYSNKTMPWGILTGIRPTKIVLELLEQGMPEKKIKSILKDDYCITDEKIDLMLTVAKIEQRIISTNKKNEYSLYIGIPFCPTRCVYCSFTSYSSSKYSDQLDNYVDALIKEIKVVEKIMAGQNIKSVYIGGGTPTSLNEKQLDRLLKELTTTIDISRIDEFTVEAGRPDTITKQKLNIIKKYRANRISINPQTMNQETLDIIGRKHTVQDIIDCFNMSRDLGFNNINMDIILGLPKESPKNVQKTINELKKLKPDSITVHTMAVKRASKLNQLPLDDIMSQAKVVEEMLAIASKGAYELGMKPYYMYRQKNMVGNFENVGYALDGKESIYNVEIMEEKQSIIALGAGAITKVVFPDENRIERIENVKNFEQYIDRIDEMIERKRKFFCYKI